LGQVALNLLVYTEELGASIRRGNAKKSLCQQEKADAAKKNAENSDDLEADLGVAAQIEAENERRLAEISQKEIVGCGLISVFGGLLIRVVTDNSGEYNSDLLMQSSVLALCRLMCVSSEFCEASLPHLFAALKRAPFEDTTMRANTVVALGDLAFRFPNEVEPYTPRLYACLRDRSIKVRRHTLMVLTHLILNDMVKVKGQVCEIALCLRDEDPRICDMSRLLFHELSKRSNNPIYNLLPDIISKLGQLSLPKEDFRGIMSYLLGFVKKEKQNEMLVEKLCQRFPKCTSIDQKADLAFCLAQLKVNERSFKYIADNFKLYKDALVDDDAKKSLLSLCGKIKKSIKSTETREIVEQWEAKVNEESTTGAENQETAANAAKAKKKAARRPTLPRQRGSGAPLTQLGSDDELSSAIAEAADSGDEFEFQCDDQDEKAAQGTQRKQKENEHQQQGKRSARTARTKAGRS
jgi:condensin complex subunit 1